MKKNILLFALALLALSLSQPAHAQIWKKVKDKVKQTAENHVIKDAGKATDKAIDKTKDATADALKKNNRQDHPTEGQQPAPAATSNPATVTTPATDVTTPVTTASYKSYDFVPGDHIIFETDFNSQQDAELPARLSTLKGNVEIQTYNGEKVVHLSSGNRVCIIPSIDSATYLPEQFTVEFDFLYQAKNPSEFNQIEVNFYTPDKTTDYMAVNSGNYHFLIYEAEQIDFGKTIQGRTLQEPILQSLKIPNRWHHIAIYVHNNVGKAYIDQYRVAASNVMMKGIAKLAIKTNGRMDYLIKNLRIAGGGSDAYHRIMTEGKLITHGIHFTSGSADLLPESMGTINEVYKILNSHPELKFEIDGHTDSDGSADLNMKLSKQRADAVKTELVKLGIDASRLTTNGLGETKPIDNNNTPEGKANNRRVEFVKK